MALRLGDTAPDFIALTTEGEIGFHEWTGEDWTLLFSHPKDFTPVCTTELGMASRLKPAFAARNVKMIGLSIDTLEDHRDWDQDIVETQGCRVNFPVIADTDRRIANLYGMVHPKEDRIYTVRSVFLISPDKKIKFTAFYPMSAGRNFDEILRVVDSLQRTASFDVVTPVNWVPGQDVIISPLVRDPEATRLFPNGFKALTKYLRFVKDPAAAQTQQVA